MKLKKLYSSIVFLGRHASFLAIQQYKYTSWKHLNTLRHLREVVSQGCAICVMLIIKKNPSNILLVAGNSANKRHFCDQAQTSVFKAVRLHRNMHRFVVGRCLVGRM